MTLSSQTLEKDRQPSETPPFSFKELKAQIPEHCFKRSNLSSFSYLLVDLAVIFLLYVQASFLDGKISNSTSCCFLKLILWPLYWFVQGCFLTGLWVLAHECGHNAFSESKTICNVVGLALHTFLLVPYHSWQISHARHHRSTNDLDRDEVFVPKTKSQITQAQTKLPSPIKSTLDLAIILLVGWPGYLLFHLTGRKYNTHADHFNPWSPLFSPKERMDVIISDLALVLWLVTLGYFVHLSSFLWIFKVYFVPYLVVNFWLVLITDLQHTDASIPHYRGEEWTWLKGALCTVDRDYGVLNNVFHHIGDTHIVHHLFPYMPHYHAVEATRVLKPLLGKYYKMDKTPIFKALWQTEKYCRYVDDESGVLWFKHG